MARVRVRIWPEREDNKTGTMIETSKEIWKKVGISGVFLGSNPRLVRVIVSGAVQFIVERMVY
ncbi:hypothetical protein EON65_05755 [archaeon]|nr:MAG: hypothetical protein EON65_05755 [archaeon]